jgi:electron transport complex protein RnfG
MTDQNKTENLKTQPSGSSRMIATMGSVGLIAGVLLVVTFQITFPFIEANRAELLERSIFEVIPNATQKAVYTKTEADKLVLLGEQGESPFRLYTGYDDQNKLRGVAVEAQGQGFQDVLRIIYGYSPDCECIVGMKVLESKETPGLGDKIEKDARFRTNFDALDVKLTPDKNQLLNPVVLVKKGQKTEKWQVEAITGATISSRAIATIINQSSQTIVPLIRKNIGILEEGQ